jgi:hypothetical protein
VVIRVGRMAGMRQGSGRPVFRRGGSRGRR